MLNCIPQRDTLKTSPWHLWMWLLGKKVFARGIKLRGGHMELGWALSQYNWHPCKKRRHTDTRGENRVRMKPETAGMRLPAEGHQGLSETPEAKHGTDFSPGPSESAARWHLDFRLPASGTVRTNFRHYKPPGLWRFVTAVQETYALQFVPAHPTPNMQSLPPYGKAGTTGQYNTPEGLCSIR